MNAGGEMGNMLAYGYAPVAIVAPVGSVGMLVNELIAVLFLNEPLRKRDLPGLVGVVGGVVFLILGSPETDTDLNVHTLLYTEVFLSPRAYWYLIFLVLLVIVFIWFVEPRYAQKHILVWLTLCSVISSVTVIACLGFSSLALQVGDDCAEEHCVHGLMHPPCMRTISHWLFCLLLSVVVVTAIWSAFYLNTETVPVYYCTFTMLSIIGGALVYNEFQEVSGAQSAMFGSGIALALCGVWLITSNRKHAKEFQDIAEMDALSGHSLPIALSFGPTGVSAAQAELNHDAAVDEASARNQMLVAQASAGAASELSELSAVSPGRSPPWRRKTPDAPKGVGRSPWGKPSADVLVDVHAVGGRHSSQSPCGFARSQDASLTSDYPGARSRGAPSGSSAACSPTGSAGMASFESGAGGAQAGALARARQARRGGRRQRDGATGDDDPASSPAQLESVRATLVLSCLVLSCHEQSAAGGGTAAGV